jgi:hypothetical protein
MNHLYEALELTHFDPCSGHQLFFTALLSLKLSAWPDKVSPNDRELIVLRRNTTTAEIR